MSICVNVTDKAGLICSTDYKTLVSMPKLSSPDKNVVRAALRTLPRRIEVAKQKEMGEMMGKLKEASRARCRA